MLSSETNVLVVPDGRVRSKADLGTMLTDPARAAPSVSGVGENDTSIREILLVVKTSMELLRPVPPSPPPPMGLATLKPLMETGT